MVKSNISTQARRLKKMVQPDKEIITAARLKNLAQAYLPIFANATPKVSGEAAASLEVVEKRDAKNTTIRMQWDNDYIDDVNAGDGENAGFADQQFNSVANRIDIQAKKEIADSFKLVGKKNKLPVR